MDQFNVLKAFCRVVEAGGFSAAAAALNVSHTALSKQIRQQEGMLGTQLLNRTTRRLALTEADLAGSHHQTAPRSTLRINEPMAFGTLDLMNWLPLPGPESRPGLQRSLRRPDRRRLRRRAAPRARTAGFVPGCTEAGAGTDAAGGIARLPAPAWRTSRAGCVGNAQLPDLYLAGETDRMAVFNAGRQASNRFRDRQLSCEYRGCAEYCGGGRARGIAPSSAFIVRHELAAGILVPMLADYPLRARDLYAIYPHNRHLPPKVRASIDFASEVYRQPDW